ncbi:PREDICTED: uncharacterized protein LOC104604644 isoform X2 [Nelumbo nucifera]|uniref:Uncharacterized protein LOC104604644 isoform X2 n=1 Tax=Nelumbo nucifera TaxID=4432 RepID=A0A1U8AVV9_NELNU|nr:PREDICTED: uncharacterized protein LOC104604644 isoform X2 [Nelumbo nucifera]
MLCSISSGKSAPNWLDRLRSSKGFPVADGLDLEHFLNPNPNQTTLSSETNASYATQEIGYSKPHPESTSLDEKPVADRKKSMAGPGDRKNQGKEDWFGIMGNVLAELFNMGDSGEFQKIRGFDEKRSCRKQPNPKICVFSASASVNDSFLAAAPRLESVPSMSPPSGDNSVTEMKETVNSLKPKKQGKVVSIAHDEDKLQTDLSTYSRVEVTIIDTSCPVWKSEKLLFRKGSVWKVRDKKWKSRNASSFRKKRKANHSDKEAGGGKKKGKFFLPLVNITREAGPEENKVPLDEGPPQDEKKAPCKESADNAIVVAKRRSFSRSPRKPAHRDSPVFHVQAVPTSRKSGVHLPRSRLKDT